MHMRKFILVDLESQIACLPAEIRQQPRDRLLSWLCQYGEVWEIERDRWPGECDFGFRSWAGLFAGFTLTDDGRIRLRGRSWSTWLRYDGPRYAGFRQRALESRPDETGQDKGR